MNQFQKIKASEEFKQLNEVSAHLGQNPLHVQGPGGNTSIKDNGAMWIKASGTWLADAMKQDIMVPVHADQMANFVNSSEFLASSSQSTIDFSASVEGAPKLKASIETAVHAIIDWSVVLHTHCVNTIAIAVRKDAPKIVEDILSDLDAVFIPYIKPGFDLADSILRNIKPSTRVLVLGNHGVVVTGDSVSQAHDLLNEVHKRLGGFCTPISEKNNVKLSKDLLGVDWMTAPFPSVQAIAFDERLIEIADGPSMYPDHTIFLGPGCSIAEKGEVADEAAIRSSGSRPLRKLVIFPEFGVAVPKNSGPAELALTRAFGDILIRIDKKAELNRFTERQEDELLNWDLEKFRQDLNQNNNQQS